VVFDPAVQPLSSEELASLVLVRTGKPLDLLEVRKTVENLHATGRFREVLVDARLAEGQVAVRIETKPNWFIGGIEVDGVSEPPNRGQLINATKLQLGAEFQTEDLRQASEQLRQKLEANGFFQARVDPDTRQDAATGQVYLHFRIDSGPRARFIRPQVEGVDEKQSARLIEHTKWRRWYGLLGWRSVTENRVNRGLENLTKSLARQDYLLNKVDLREMEYIQQNHRAKPKIDVDLGAQVRVQVVGAKVSRGKLRQLVPVYQEQAVDRDLLVEGLRNLYDYFQSQGYFRATIDFDSRNEADGSQTIVYQVNRGERYKLVRFEIEGDRYFPEETIRERLNLQPATFLRYRWGRFSEQYLRSDETAIRALYLSNGFRDVRVESKVDENYQGRKNHLAVLLTITEGPQWLVAEQQLEGVSTDHLRRVEPLIGSSAGQPFSENSLATDRDNVLNYYYNRGYPQVTFEWRVTPAPEPNKVNVRLLIQEGPQQFVRGFLIGGLQTSDPEMVFERIRLSQGDPLSQARLVESQRRLYDLGIFARVEMAVQNPEGNESSKYILYQFEEARKYSVSLGLGAEIARIGGGTPNFDAPAGEPGFSPRVSVGLSRTNFLGAGHTVGIQTRFSNIQQRALGTYLAPQFKGKESVALTVSALYDISRDIRTFEGRRLEGAIQLSQKLSLAETLQTRFTYRRNTVHNLAIGSELIPIYSRPVRVGIISSTLFQDRRDDPIDSHRGYYNSVDLGWASKAFASGTDYLRLLARNSTYHRVYKDLVFARSSTLGWIHNLRQDGPEGIPLPERYFSGGAATHRGFPDNQAGPRDLVTGFPLGGSAMLTNNLELRFPLYGDNIRGVVFHDAGNIYTRLKKLSLRVSQRNLRDFDYMVHAIGFGLRYKTPVGPVRVDLAYGPNNPRFQFERRTDPGVPPFLVTERISRFQFHFSLGQTF